MKKDQIAFILEDLVERLAAIEHDRWSHWQRYMHSKGDKRSDGTLVLPAKLVAQWEQQIATPYSALTDKEKESDREQVRNYLPMVVEHLASRKLCKKDE